MSCTFGLTWIVHLMHFRAMHLSIYMDRKKLRDAQVARQIGASRVSVSRYRRGLIRPSWATASKIKKWTRGEVSFDDWVTLPRNGKRR